MGSLLTVRESAARAPADVAWPRIRAALEIAGLTAVAFAVLGYHPAAEDGGLYLQGLELALRPELFPASRAFVAPQMRYSVFVPVVSGLSRWLRAPLLDVVLVVHVASLLLLLLAVGRLAAVCWEGRAERRWAVLLTALWMGLPVAGTSLQVADPYLTARSLALPCVVLAMAVSAGTGKWRVWWAAGLLGVAAALHPLVALDGGVLCLGLAVGFRDQRWQGQVRVWGGLCVGVLLAGWAAVLVSPGESEAYRVAAMSRSYWFPGQWRWYEWVGVAGPVLAMAMAAWWVRRRAVWALSGAAGGAASTATAVCLLWARSGAASHAVARLQPMRLLQLVTLLMLVVVGGAAGRRVGRWPWWQQGLVAVLLGLPLLAGARAVYRSSAHLELGAWRDRNAWVQGFDWVRLHTAEEAVVALDADYITQPGEDAQSFRAVAERSSLPDWSKDGGEASIAPELAEPWHRGVLLQTGLSEVGDEERRRRLLPAGVSWVVLQARAQTALPCPFENTAVKVCALR